MNEVVVINKYQTTKVHFLPSDRFSPEMSMSTCCAVVHWVSFAIMYLPLSLRSCQGLYGKQSQGLYMIRFLTSSHSYMYLSVYKSYIGTVIVPVAYDYDAGDVRTDPDARSRPSAAECEFRKTKGS